jgi:RNA polymerase primary sigma factor
MSELTALRFSEEYPSDVPEMPLPTDDDYYRAVGDRLLNGAEVSIIPPAEDRYATVNALQRYMQEVKKYELLDKDQEVELAKKIEAGVLAQARLDDPTLMMHNSYRDDLEIVALDGQLAKARMIEANLRLVVKIVGPLQTRQAPLLDLIQEGNAGLMHAVEMFDYTKGLKFSTYATNWIKNYAITYRDQQSIPILLSAGMHSDRRKVVKFVAEHMQEDGEEPSIDVIAAGTKLSPKQVENIKKWFGFTSIDARLEEGDSKDFGNLLQDEYAEPVVDAALGQTYIMDKVMEQVFTTDAQKQAAAAIILSLGLPFNPTFISPQFAKAHSLEQGKEYKLWEIAKFFGVSRSAISLWRNQAFDILRQPENVQALRNIAD